MKDGEFAEVGEATEPTPIAVLTADESARVRVHRRRLDEINQTLTDMAKEGETIKKLMWSEIFVNHPETIPFHTDGGCELSGIEAAEPGLVKVFANSDSGCTCGLCGGDHENPRQTLLKRIVSG